MMFNKYTAILIFLRKYLRREKNCCMIILGIDPGTATTGYGVIESTNNKFKLCEYGVIKTLPDLPLPLRLKKIYDNIKKLIKNTSLK